MINCTNCNKKIWFFQKKCYDYPSKKKGSFEITEEKIICKKCAILKYANPDEAILEFIELFDKGKFKEALKILNEKDNKNSPAYWYHMGLTCTHLRNPKKALEYFDEALYRDSHYTKAWFYKGRVLIDLKKFSDAIKAFKNVMKLGPANSQKRYFGAMLLTAAAYNNMKNHKLAEKWMNLLFSNIAGNIEYPEFIEMVSVLETDYSNFVKECFSSTQNFEKMLNILIRLPFVKVNEIGLKH